MAKSSIFPLLSLNGITKSFPGVLANDSINLDIYPSETHALLGENGAGKSTLVKILYGFYHADHGEIRLKDKPVEINSPADARRLEIGMVFQDFSLIPAFTVAENIALFLPSLAAVVNQDEIAKRIHDTSARYQLDVDPYQLVAHLSLGAQQKVEILKLLLSNARVLILDEPTRVLAPHEVDVFFHILAKLKKDGYAILLITHKLREVIESADRVTVLRKGKVSGTLQRKEINEQNLIKLMFAKSLSPLNNTARKKRPSSETLLKLDAVRTHSEGGSIALVDIHLEIHAGEIVGIAGVSGNGQKELGDVVLGMTNCTEGKKWLFNQNATHWSIQQVRNSGVAFIPENPLQMAVTGWLPVLFNMALTRTRYYALWGGLNMNWKKVAQDTSKAYANLGFDLPQFFVPAQSLSGGNLQRLTIARELFPKPRLIVASYITRGLDVQSTLAAQQALRDARGAGSGVLLISEDLEELFELSDRLVVMFAGCIVGQFTPQQTSQREVGLLMTGSKVKHAQ